MIKRIIAIVVLIVAAMLGLGWMVYMRPSVRITAFYDEYNFSWGSEMTMYGDKARELRKLLEDAYENSIEYKPAFTVAPNVTSWVSSMPYVDFEFNDGFHFSLENNADCRVPLLIQYTNKNGELINEKEMSWPYIWKLEQAGVDVHARQKWYDWMERIGDSKAQYASAKEMLLRMDEVQGNIFTYETLQKLLMHAVEGGIEEAKEPLKMLEGITPKHEELEWTEEEATEN